MPPPAMISGRLRTGQQHGGLPDEFGIAGGGRGCTKPRRLAHVLDLGHLSENIARQVERHGTAARRERRGERLAHHFRDAARLRHRPGFLGDRLEERLLVHLLEGVAVDMGRGERAGQRNHRRIGGVRLREPGHQVRRARPVLPGEEHAGAARGARVAVGHVHAGALVAHADEADGLRVVQRIEDLHPGRADEAEHVPHALGFQRRHHRLATTHLCHRDSPWPGSAGLRRATALFELLVLLDQDGNREVARMNAHDGHELDRLQHFVAAGARLEGVRDVAADARRVQVGRRRVDGDEDEFAELGRQMGFGVRHVAEAQVGLHELRIERAHLVPGGIPVATADVLVGHGGWVSGHVDSCSESGGFGRGAAG